MCLECRNWDITGILIAQSNYSQTQHLSPTHVIESCLMRIIFWYNYRVRYSKITSCNHPFSTTCSFLPQLHLLNARFLLFSLLVFLGHAQLRPLVTSCSLRKNIAANVFYMLRGFHLCACASPLPPCPLICLELFLCLLVMEGDQAAAVAAAPQSYATRGKK